MQITILKAKIVSLTELTEVIVSKYEKLLKEKDEEIELLKTNINK